MSTTHKSVLRQNVNVPVFSVFVREILCFGQKISTTNGEQVRARTLRQVTIHIHVFRVFLGLLGVSLNLKQYCRHVLSNTKKFTSYACYVRDKSTSQTWRYYSFSNVYFFNFFSRLLLLDYRNFKVRFLIIKIFLSTLRAESYPFPFLSEVVWRKRGISAFNIMCSEGFFKRFDAYVPITGIYKTSIWAKSNVFLSILPAWKECQLLT